MARFFNLSYSSHVLSIESIRLYPFLLPLLFQLSFSISRSFFQTYTNNVVHSQSLSADRTKQSLSIDFSVRFSSSFSETNGHYVLSMRKFLLRNNFNIKSDVVRTSKSACLSEIYTRKLITQVSQEVECHEQQDTKLYIK